MKMNHDRKTVFLLILMLGILFLQCQKGETLYLGQEETLSPEITIEENTLVKLYIYSGSLIRQYYPLQGDINTASIQYKLLLAAGGNFGIEVIAGLKQSGEIVTLGSDKIMIEGPDGVLYEGVIRGDDLETAEGDTLILEMRGLSSGRSVLFLTPEAKKASRIIIH